MEAPLLEAFKADPEKLMRNERQKN